MDLGCPVRDWQVRGKCKEDGCARKPELRRAAAGTRGCCQARRFACGFVEVVARELGVPEGGELILRQAGRCQWDALPGRQR